MSIITATTFTAAVGTSDGSAPQASSGAISALTQLFANPATNPHTTGGSARRAPVPSATLSQRPPFSPRAHQARCVRSMNASEHGAATRSRSSPLHANSPCCSSPDQRARLRLRAAKLDSQEDPPDATRRRCPIPKGPPRAEPDRAPGSRTPRTGTRRRGPRRTSLQAIRHRLAAKPPRHATT